MPEYFIITIADERGKFEVDLQIPSGIKVSDFDMRLLEILKILSERDFGHFSNVRLNLDARVLHGSETLAEAGAFDGARITVTES